MTPFFSPGPLQTAVPQIVVAAVGETMCQVAGEVCDGILVDGFTTERYIREVTLLAVHRGQHSARRPMEHFEVVGLAMATG